MCVWKGDNVWRAGIHHRGNRETQWAQVSSTHGYRHMHRLAFLYQLHYRIPMATALVAHPKIIVMHKIS